MAERRFAEQFNVPSAPLRDWPARKIADYLVIMQALDEVEAEQAKQSGQPPPAANRTPGSVPQHVKAAAAPPPMPPAMP